MSVFNFDTAMCNIVASRVVDDSLAAMHCKTVEALGVGVWMLHTNASNIETFMWTTRDYTSNDLSYVPASAVGTYGIDGGEADKMARGVDANNGTILFVNNSLAVRDDSVVQRFNYMSVSFCGSKLKK